MSKYRNNLPQLGDRLFLTDGGLETTLIFHDGIELPHFASFDLLKSETGVARLRSYKESYIALAKRAGIGFILEGATWRANPDWGVKLGYSREALAQANRRSIEMMAELRRKHETRQTPIVISGNIGPRGDGYKADNRMTAKEAQDYHSFQIGIFAGTEADMTSAFTINYVDEAIGIVRAAKAAQIPAVISFTLETDGKLPSGQSLKDAIEQCDWETGKAAAYYMINCAHPTHFEAELRKGGDWLNRLRGLRANSSKRSHAELDVAPDLDIGNPVELGQEYRKLRAILPQLTILGGCCGTDHRHVEQICASCVAAEAAA
ncbi:MAG: homocysteine S-methyltransferase [Alphaproteobacteria bacterium]|nr:homocysteine S-methyltransferase [Alphaproteobacteria bacterium]